MAGHFRIRTVYRSPNYSERPAGTKIWVWVNHHTAGSFESCKNWFLTTRSEVSAHYVVTKSGQIYEFVPPAKKAWHAGVSDWKGHGSVNDFSLGCEIVNAGDNKDPFPLRQVCAVAWLTRKMMAEYGIDLSNVTDHKAVNDRKIDMRANWPNDMYRHMLRDREFFRAKVDEAWPPKVIVLPVPEKKPPWWTKMRTWLRLYKKRRP